MPLGETFDLGRVYAAGEAIKGARMRNERDQRDLDLDELVRKTARESVVNGDYDLNAHVDALTRAGHPDVAQKVRHNALKLSEFMLDYAERVFPYASNENWPTIRKQLGGLGIQVPETYDPKWVQDHVAKLKGNFERWSDPQAFNVDTPHGKVSVVGQKNETTGQLRELYSAVPPSQRYRGAGGRDPRTANQKNIEDLKARGIPEDLAVRLVYRRIDDPRKAWQAAYDAVLKSTYDEQLAKQEADGIIAYLYGDNALDHSRQPFVPGGGPPAPQVPQGPDPNDPLGWRRPTR